MRYQIKGNGLFDILVRINDDNIAQIFRWSRDGIRISDRCWQMAFQAWDTPNTGLGDLSQLATKNNECNTVSSIMDV